MHDSLNLEEIVNRDPEIMGGTPVFMGTRVPIKTMFDYLEGNYSLEQFLEQFPTVKRAQATALLELYKDLLLARA